MLRITNNYHTHTSRCGHASGEDEEYVLEAIKAGIKKLGFSDHVPWPTCPQPGIRMNEDLLENYVKSITFLKNKYKDQIEIHLGFEAEVVDQYMPYYKWLKEEVGIEYFILGQHGEVDKDNKAFFYNWYSNSKEMASRYVEQVIKGMESGLFSYVAHPDHFLNGYRLNDEFIENQIRQICEKSKELNIPLEINLTYPRIAKLKGCEHDPDALYPFDKFWKIAGEVGSPVVIGIDAHDPKDFRLDYNNVIFYFKDKFKLNIIDFSL